MGEYNALVVHCLTMSQSLTPRAHWLPHDSRSIVGCEQSDWHFEAVDFYELYDQRSDPHQLRNLFYRSSAEGGVSAGVKQELHERLRRAWACRGETCG